MDAWMDGQEDGWIDKWMDGRMDGWIGEWEDGGGWEDNQLVGQQVRIFITRALPPLISGCTNVVVSADSVSLQPDASL